MPGADLGGGTPFLYGKRKVEGESLARRTGGT